MIHPDYEYSLEGGYKLNGPRIEITPRWDSRAKSILRLQLLMGEHQGISFNPQCFTDNPPICYFTPGAGFEIIDDDGSSFGYKKPSVLATQEDLSVDENNNFLVE